eukprot:CAMPEP_0113303558 /NCGR_PEP_ID=MMETSP0010_2-20120614/3926_1 /TAXON_ID=216773 ORGANISM="Corethron hystrix, Strain 308" /NCGR_SAMPLE_ID=MMETSP0010_2 /ASSEMBLY_ACC=CAM_ASM_000155 /LENGTH=68 /DNA_ID=CAMNT_0000157579 /DNA_START=301 /DNA_END=507 /DNA_ORIENTATION=- /assembly_acc=CAM_ASM_000155
MAINTTGRIKSTPETVVKAIINVLMVKDENMMQGAVKPVETVDGLTIQLTITKVVLDAQDTRDLSPWA